MTGSPRTAGADRVPGKAATTPRRAGKPRRAAEGVRCPGPDVHRWGAMFERVSGSPRWLGADELPPAARAAFDRWLEEARDDGPAAEAAGRLGVAVAVRDMFEPSGRLVRSTASVFRDLALALDPLPWSAKRQLATGIFGGDGLAHVIEIVESVEGEGCGGTGGDDDLLARIVGRVLHGHANERDEEWLCRAALLALPDAELLGLRQDERDDGRRGRPAPRWQGRAERWRVVKAARWHRCGSGPFGIRPGERYLEVEAGDRDGRAGRSRHSRTAIWLYVRRRDPDTPAGLREALDRLNLAPDILIDL